MDCTRLRRNVRIRHMKLNPNPEHNPRLHAHDRAWEPNLAPGEVETALNNFEKATKKEFLASRKQACRSNLTKTELQRLKTTKSEGMLSISELDKGLGTVIMERTQAIQQTNKEHLNNRDNYEPMTEETAKAT